MREIVAAAAPTVATHVLALPWNTGRDDFRGHRIYAACMHFVNGRFVGLLDDDNWIDDDHVSSLMACAVLGRLEWAYALRKIVRRDGTLIANDDCQSLGAWESIEAERGKDRLQLAETNCYFLRRDIAVAHSPVWHRRSFDGRRSPDVVLCETLLANHPRFGTSGRYSVNYSVDHRLTAEKVRFFHEGNAAMRSRYPNGFPWAAAPIEG